MTSRLTCKQRYIDGPLKLFSDRLFFPCSRFKRSKTTASKCAAKAADAVDQI